MPLTSSEAARLRHPNPKEAPHANFSRHRCTRSDIHPRPGQCRRWSDRGQESSWCEGDHGPAGGHRQTTGPERVRAHRPCRWRDQGGQAPSTHRGAHLRQSAGRNTFHGVRAIGWHRPAAQGVGVGRRISPSLGGLQRPSLSRPAPWCCAVPRGREPAQGARRYRRCGDCQLFTSLRLLIASRQPSLGQPTKIIGLIDVVQR